MYAESFLSELAESDHNQIAGMEGINFCFYLYL